MIAAEAKIGPRHHDRKMSLKTFEFAPVVDGYRYELARRSVVVSDVPKYSHTVQVLAITRALKAHDASHPGVIHAVLGGSDCKPPTPEWESERRLARWTERTLDPADACETKLLAEFKPLCRAIFEAAGEEGDASAAAEMEGRIDSG
jgi:hypothetical protein